MKGIGGADMSSIYKFTKLNYGLVIKNCNKVLSYVFKRSDSFSIVTDLVRPYSKIPPSCKQDKWIFDLKDYLLSQEVGAREWPGIINRDCHKVLSNYKACKKTLTVLQAWPNVFNACEKGLPEDICFYCNGRVWFSTTSHERTADVIMSTQEDVEFFSEFI